MTTLYSFIAVQGTWRLRLFALSARGKAGKGVEPTCGACYSAHAKSPPRSARMPIPHWIQQPSVSSRLAPEVEGMASSGEEEKGKGMWPRRRRYGPRGPLRVEGGCWAKKKGGKRKRKERKEKKRARPKKNFQIIFSHILAILEIQNFHSKLNIKSGMNAIIHLWP